MRTLPALFTGLVLLASFTRAGGKVALVGSESRIDFGVRREAALWYDSAAQQFVFDKDVRAPNLDALQAQVDEISIPVALSDLTDDLTPSLASVATSGSFNDLTNRPVIPTLSNSVTSTSASTGASSMAVKSANDLAATVQTELASLQAQLTSMRGFSKPDWIGAWRSAGTDTDITWTHNLKTEDLFYVIQLRFPNGEITQMNPMLTFPYHDLAKPQGLSVIVTSTQFKCRTGRGLSYIRRQEDAQTGYGVKSCVTNTDRTGYQLRIIAYAFA